MDNAKYTVEITKHPRNEGFTAALYVDGIEPDQYDSVWLADRPGQGLVHFKPLWQVPTPNTREAAHEQLDQRIVSELTDLLRSKRRLTARESARLALLEGYFGHQAKVVDRMGPCAPSYGAPSA